jgi:hypothetical protein
MKHTNLTTGSIKQLLNHSATHIDEATVANLRTARTRALESYRAQQHAPVLAWLNHHGILISSSSSGHRNLNWVLALVFAACLLSGAAYWHNANEHEHDHSEIDIAILTDDLPVDAYVE